MLPHQIAQVIDHYHLNGEQQDSLLQEQKAQVAKLVDEAHQAKAFSVYVRGSMVSYACQLIRDRKNKLKVCSLIGFPNSDLYTTRQKIEFLEKARIDGAEEFDMVLKVADLKAGKDEEVYLDVKEVSIAAKHNCLKVSLEMELLNPLEKIRAIELVMKAFKHSHYIDYRLLKTSTGFLPPTNSETSPATIIEDVKLIHKHSQGHFGINPAGAIAHFQDAKNMWYAAGAPTLENGDIDPYLFRIGSSSLLLSLKEKVASEPAY